MNFLADAGLAAVTGFLATGYVRERRSSRHIQHKVEGQDKILVARANHSFDPVTAVAWLSRLTQFRRPESERFTKGQVKFTWRIEKDAHGEVRFYFHVPLDRERGVEGILPPTLEWFPAPEHTAPSRAWPIMWLGIENPVLPLQRASKRDVFPAVLRAMAPEMALEITISPTYHKEYIRQLKRAHGKLEPGLGRLNSGWMEAGRELANVFQDGFRDVGQNLQGRSHRSTGSRAIRTEPSILLPNEQGQLQAMKERYTDVPYLMDVTMNLRILREEKNPNAYFQGVLGALLDLSSTHNRIVEFRRPSTFSLSTSELANLMHIPSPGTWSQMPVIRAHARTLQDDELSTGIAIGYLQHPILTERLVCIPDKQFERHFLLSGKTGAGKSTTLVFLIQSLLERWVRNDGNRQPGMTLIDPASETALIILSRLQSLLPKDSPLWQKVHYLSFFNGDIPVGLNMLQVLSVDGVLELLQGEYGGGARLDRLIRNAVETLKEDTTVKHTLVGISPLLRDEKWRNRILPRVQNPFLREFWERDFPVLAKSPDVFQPVENRLSPFLSGDQRLYFGQPDYVLPIRKWMDEGHIFLVDVKALGKTLMELMIGTMIEHYHWVAQTRPESTSLTHYLMVDECHRVQTWAMKEIIKEDRKHGVSLGLITQSVEQFAVDLKREIKDNLGTIISLRQGAEGAKTIAEISNGHFEVEALKNLNDNVAAVFTTVDEKNLSIETKATPPDTYEGYYPDTKPLDFNDKPGLERRYSDLKQFGANIQRELGRPAANVEEEFYHYLQFGRWPNQSKESSPSGEQSIDTTKEKKKATANDYL